MTINVNDLRQYIIVPVLNGLDLYSDSGVNIELGTSAQESGMGSYLHQVNGPALGIYQMEPATHDDIWTNYLAYKPDLVKKLRQFSNGTRDENQLVGNLFYATAMTRIFYLRCPEPLPDADDILGLGQYYKKYYNTSQGKATVEQFVENYKKYVL